MEQLVLVVHVLAALAIIGLILMQQGKGAEAGASFGAGASQTVFGGQGGGNFFSRATGVFALIFFVSSLGLATIARQQAAVDSDAGIPAVIEQSAELPAVEVSDVPVVESDVPAVKLDAAVENEVPDIDPAQ